ncbi:GNAT family N-acetyltransferase [Bradyrhizobium sp.]|uniref:GNAT family N-acetyltransferase n=1 Tax=Bradyrhizobium sp. TaxID=376 RepID=UPI0025B7A955|nr:GNAT family N-acetyltransferase [Bradyrhizobium sp.]
MSEQSEIRDLHSDTKREALLRLNNANARETSLLTSEHFDRLINSARLALFTPPAVALLLAFEDTDDYDGGHFLWFRGRLDRFLYIDRVVVAETWRRHGLARILYEDVFKRAILLGHSRIVCEVNVLPPNPVSDKFHQALGFEEIGRATINGGAKTVRYLAANL